MRFIILCVALTLLACVPAHHKETFIVIGDSYSAGTGATTNWPTLLAKQRGMKVINPSKNGYTTLDAIRELPQLPKEAEFAIIMIGVNDYVQGRSPSGFKESLDVIIKDLQKRTMTIYLITIPDFTLSPTGRRYGTAEGITTFNAIIKEAENPPHVISIDIQEMELPQEVYDDGLHPNAEGHRLWKVFIEDRVAYH